jgi:hypothetical protein
LDEFETEEAAITTKKKPAPMKMSLDEFLAAAGPGEPLEVLRDRQEIELLEGIIRGQKALTVEG